LTGSVPFIGDKISIVHSHITKKLPTLECVPGPINEILQKMCEKNSNERYSTAKSLRKDLEFCLQNISTLSEINFICGKNESKLFQIPSKLYGREIELSLLRDYISSSESKLCCVSGYSGSGKSKLIEELKRDSNNELLMSFGKFDQFDRSTPYVAFIK
jgi:serine/threonine protein kinase